MNEESMIELVSETESAVDQLSGLKVGTPEYKIGTESVDKLAEILRAEEAAKHEREEKARKAKTDFWFRVGELALGAVGTLGSLAMNWYFGRATFRFEETGTITSFGGKLHLQKLLRK